MIRIYTDLNNLPSQFIPQIVEHNPQFKYSSSINDCDFILLPFWEAIFKYTDKQYLKHNLDPAIRSTVTHTAKELIKLASDYKKKILIFQFSDNESELPINNAVFFRTSLYKSKQKMNEFALPASNGDLIYDFNRKLEPRKKSETPSVGFIGSSRPLDFSLLDFYRSSINLTSQFLGNLELPLISKHGWNAGQILRKKAMVNLLKNKHITTDFTVIIRGYLNQPSVKKKEFNKNRFVENIFNNDYTLCVRGAGNYSFRFYETLSAGRIPLFVNTDCVLPYDFIIDWKKYCVWIDESDVEKIDQVLLDFHNDLSEDDFEELQIEIRKLWDEWISSKAFYKNFDRHILDFK